MASVSPRKSNQLRSTQIVRLQMKWRTENNKLDCRVFTVNHMETYMGNGLHNRKYKFFTEEVCKSQYL